jgi:hypothetical protein
VTTLQGSNFTVATTIIPGAPPGSFPCPGVAAGDTLISVRHVAGDLQSNDDLTDDFTISGDGEISNAAASPESPDTSGDLLIATWARP